MARVPDREAVLQALRPALELHEAEYRRLTSAILQERDFTRASKITDRLGAIREERDAAVKAVLAEWT